MILWIFGFINVVVLLFYLISLFLSDFELELELSGSGLGLLSSERSLDDDVYTESEVCFRLRGFLSTTADDDFIDSSEELYFLIGVGFFKIDFRFLAGFSDSTDSGLLISSSLDSDFLLSESSSDSSLFGGVSGVDESL